MKLTAPVTQYFCPEQVIKSERLNPLQKIVLIFMFNNFSGKLSLPDLVKFTGAKQEVIEHEINDMVNKGIIDSTSDSFFVRSDIVLKMGFAPQVKKERPVIEKKEIAPPTLEQWIEYFVSNGYKREIAITSWRGYDAANWHDSKGRKILNPKQKALHVWFKEEHKDPNRKGPTKGNGGLNK
jgi:hypothetical protein